MDKLKDYLLLHKADLDVDSPANDTWEHIESKIADRPDQPGIATRVLRYAAAACVIALAGVGLWMAINIEAIKKEPVPGKEKIETTLRKEEKTPDKDLVRNTSKPKQVRYKARSQKPAKSSYEIDIIDKSYSSLIDYQLRKLRTTPLYAENGSYFSFYVEQLKQMDQDEQEVRNDIKTYGLTTEFLGQLINVYQQKLNLLKNLQAEINKMNNKVKEKQAPSEKAEVHYLNI
jgi:hypothetical protein